MKNSPCVFSVFMSFFKVGLIGFGGGSALIPVIEREIVQSHQMMDDSDYLKHTVVSNITPGALPAKMGATIGFQLRGLSGSLAGAAGVSLPGVALTIFLLSLFSFLSPETIHYINYASVGITTFIVFLLLHFVMKTVSGQSVILNLALTLSAFLATGGKEIRHFLGLLFSIDVARLGTPLLDITTIDLIIVTFFVLMTLEWVRCKSGACLITLISLAFILTSGKAAASYGWNRFHPVTLVMMAIVLAYYILVRRDRTGKSAMIYVNRSSMVTVFVFLAVPVSMAALYELLSPVSGSFSVVQFLIKAAVSTVTSFGGGEAYVSIADGIFVQSGMIEPGIYYSRLVPIANALPGPILLKIIAGIGFVLGSQTGSILAGWGLGLLAASLALGVCCAIAILVLAMYDQVSGSLFIKNLKRYILPVICGMLISTCFAMINESLKISNEKGFSAPLALVAMVLAIVGLFQFQKRLKLHDLLLLIIPTALSLVIFRVF